MPNNNLRIIRWNKRPNLLPLLYSSGGYSPDIHRVDSGFCLIMGVGVRLVYDGFETKMNFPIGSSQLYFRCSINFKSCIVMRWMLRGKSFITLRVSGGRNVGFGPWLILGTGINTLLHCTFPTNKIKQYNNVQGSHKRSPSAKIL